MGSAKYVMVLLVTSALLCGCASERQPTKQRVSKSKVDALMKEQKAREEMRKPEVDAFIAKVKEQMREDTLRAEAEKSSASQPPEKPQEQPWEEHERKLKALWKFRYTSLENGDVHAGMSVNRFLRIWEPFGKPVEYVKRERGNVFGYNTLTLEYRDTTSRYRHHYIHVHFMDDKLSSWNEVKF